MGLAGDARGGARLIGWAMLALIGATAAALLAAGRVPRALWTSAASFLLLGAAGYAWQGSPALRGHPVAAQGVKSPVDPAYRYLRDAMFGRFGGESVYFGISDRQLADGDTRLAAAVLAGAVDYAPTNAAFWTEFGNVIALHDRDMVSPASLFSYRRAMRVAPTHPGPPFFLGWAYVRAGQSDEARRWWARALALSPPTAGYRAAIAERLAMLDAYLGQSAPPR